MAKFMILYNSMSNARERMASATPEQMKASMDAWMAWQEGANKTAKLEWGLPLQTIAQISAEGESDSNCKTTGYATAEAETKEVLVDLLKSHPHLQEAGSTIDVLEMISMPGMQ